MRVLLLVRTLDVGGLESVVLDLARGAGDYGVQIHLGCLYGLGVHGANACMQGTWVGNLDKQGTIKTIYALCRYILRNKIDIIHSHNPQPHLFAVLASIVTRVPVVHTKHGRNYPENPKRVWLNRQLSRFSRRVVAVSENASAVATGIEKVPAEKVLVIRNGVDTGRFKSTDGGGRKAEFGGQGSLTIGTVGRLSSEKNYTMLINAFSLLKCSSNITLRLLIVGDGPEREMLERAAEGLNVEFVGMQARVEGFLSQMDVFCLASLTEGTSMTLLEAGACGLPSVVTDVGGNREIILDGKTGFVTPSGDADALAGALCRLIADPGLRLVMGQAASERVSAQYSLEQMVHAYACVYRSVLQED